MEKVYLGIVAVIVASVSGFFGTNTDMPSYANSVPTAKLDTVRRNDILTDSLLKLRKANDNALQHEQARLVKMEKIVSKH